MSEWQKTMNKSPKDEGSFLGKMFLLLGLLIALAWTVDATDVGSKEQINSVAVGFDDFCRDIFNAIDKAMGWEEEK